MVTNQDGRGTPAFPEAAFQEVQDFVLRLFASQGITFSRVFVCPHRPEDRCTCRKPNPGHLGDFLATVTLDRDASFVAGDRATDLEFARNIGVRGFRVDPTDPESWAAIAHAVVDRPRTATVVRETRETRISVSVDLDAEKPGQHPDGNRLLRPHAGPGREARWLRADARLRRRSAGGRAPHGGGRRAGPRRGAEDGTGRQARYRPLRLPAAHGRDRGADQPGSFRPRLPGLRRGSFPRAEVGQLPTELVPHFFRSVADSLGANLHIAVRGENTHHMVEACFKGFGRTLRQAIAQVGHVPAQHQGHAVNPARGQARTRSPSSTAVAPTSRRCALPWRVSAWTAS